MPTLPPAIADGSTLVAESIDWPALPTETEIYILPDGRVVVADLPAELAAALGELGVSEPGIPGISEPASSER